MKILNNLYVRTWLLMLYNPCSFCHILLVFFISPTRPLPKLHYGKTSLGKCSHQRARNQNKILIFCRLPYFCLLAYMKKTILDTPSQCQYNDENKCSDWSVGSVTLRPFPSNQPSDGHEGGYTSKKHLYVNCIVSYRMFRNSC